MTVPAFVQSWKLTGNNDYAISLSCSGIVGGNDHAIIAIGLRWGNTSHEHFTECTVGGVSATLVDYIEGTYTEASIGLSIFFLLNPPTGTQTVWMNNVGMHYGQMFVGEFSGVAGYGVSGNQVVSSGNAVYQSLSGLTVGRDLVIAAFGTGDYWGPTYAAPLIEMARNENNLVDNRYDSMFSWGYGEPTANPQTFGVSNCASPKGTLLLLELIGLSEKTQQIIWFS